MKADRHPSEEARLAALHSYGILDTGAEPEFDEIVRVVSAVCGAPISVITLVESGRQWFKAKVGLDITETPVSVSVCAHGILQPDMLEIEDMTKDVRTIDNPFVQGQPHARFYAGAALLSDEGLPLGMLCVLDYQPRKLTPVQRDLLQVMARLVMRQMELRRVLNAERKANLLVQEVLDKANALLDRNTLLRHEIDHRVKNSLTQVAAFLRLQERKYRDEPRIAEALGEARNRVVTVANVHDHLHKAAEDDKVSVRQFLDTLVENIAKNRPARLQAITVEADNVRLRSDKIMALGLAVNEVVANAMKHAFPEGRAGSVRISFRCHGEMAELAVTDTGVGVPQGFELAGGAGLGMRLLNGLAQQLGGTVSHDGRANGTCFTIRFPLEGAA